jgi:hypothetical protein
MIKKLINGIKIREAIEQFGSLEKAVENLRKEKRILEKQNITLNQENSRLEQKKNKVSKEIGVVESKLRDINSQFTLLKERYNDFSRQYDLFEGFMVMVKESETADNCVINLIDIFQTLVNDGWCIRRKADEVKSIFVSTVLGDFLKCFQCKNCKARFIVNKNPRDKYTYNYYQCPACHTSAVKADDTFLRDLLTEKKLEDIVHVEDLMNELELLRPFRILLDVRCEICGKPITEWTESNNLKIGIYGFGWGHDACWNSPTGKFKLYMNTYKAAIEKRVVVQIG